MQEQLFDYTVNVRINFRLIKLGTQCDIDMGSTNYYLLLF